MGPPETKRDTAAEGLGRAIAERQESNSFALLLEVGLLRFYPRALQERAPARDLERTCLVPGALAHGFGGPTHMETHAHSALAAGVGSNGVLQTQTEDE